MALRLKVKLAYIGALAVVLGGFDVPAAAADPFQLSDVELDVILAGASAAGTSQAHAAGTASQATTFAGTIAASVPGASATGVAVGAAAGAASGAGPVLATATVSYSHGNAPSDVVSRTSARHSLAAVIVAKVSAKVRVY